MIKYKLDTPIDDLKIIELREPDVGDLRGLKLTDIAQLDTEAICKLLVKISNLSASQVNRLKAIDFIAISTEIANFLSLQRKNPRKNRNLYCRH